jgi:hypothetical protein
MGDIFNDLALSIASVQRGLDYLRGLRNRLASAADGGLVTRHAWDEGCAGVYLREWPDGRREAYTVETGGAHPPSVGGHTTTPLYRLSQAAALILDRDEED